MQSSFKKPDLKAPRYRPKVYRVLNKDLFKQFKEKYPKYNSISYQTFKAVINSVNELLYNTVIDYRDGVELPESLGFLFIGTCEAACKKENINYGKSIKYGTKVSFQNWDSDGKLGKIFYTNYAVKYKVQDRQIWTFIPCRTFKRKVAKEYPSNWTKYIKVDNRLRISRLYYKLTLNEQRQKKMQEDIKNYNEFNLEE